MPFSEKQRKAAGAELARRRRGVKKTRGPTRTRPLGSASLKALRDLASKPVKTKRRPRLERKR